MPPLEVIFRGVNLDSRNVHEPPGVGCGVSHAVGYAIPEAGKDSKIGSGLLACAVERLDVSGIRQSAFDLGNDIDELALAE